jgi:hypothetical protein
MGVDYKALSDEEKIELLRLLYHETRSDPAFRELIIEETQLVYRRIKNERLN